MSDTVKCQNPACNATGQRRRMTFAPEGWLYVEVNDDDEPLHSSIIISVCSEACAAALWQRGPGRLFALDGPVVHGTSTPAREVGEAIAEHQAARWERFASKLWRTVGRPLLELRAEVSKLALAADDAHRLLDKLDAPGKGCPNATRPHEREMSLADRIRGRQEDTLWVNAKMCERENAASQRARTHMERSFQWHHRAHVLARVVRRMALGEALPNEALVLIDGWRGKR